VVERHLAKVNVARSNRVTRLLKNMNLNFNLLHARDALATIFGSVAEALGVGHSTPDLKSDTTLAQTWLVE
jgi:hypothetical protein